MINREVEEEDRLERMENGRKKIEAAIEWNEKRINWPQWMPHTHACTLFSLSQNHSHTLMYCKQCHAH